jgi:hypothetical protein
VTKLGRILFDSNQRGEIELMGTESQKREKIIKRAPVALQSLMRVNSRIEAIF